MTADAAAPARTLAVRNPRSGAVDYTVQPPDAAQLAPLAARLRHNQAAWQAAGFAHRVAVLRKWAGELGAQPGDTLQALSTDTGRWLLAQSEIAPLRGIVEGNAALGAQLLQGGAERPSVAAGVAIDTQLVPYSLVGVISPWNFPFLLSMLDAVPALLAGCAVIAKPSEVTPRFVAPLMTSIARHPELAGVLAFVAGDGVTGAALVESSDFICFTGSVATGRKIAEACARRFIPASLELGGKDPAIVLASADAARAAGLVLRAAVQATGQACQSLERVYVARPLYEQFVAELVTQAQAVELNYPDIHRGHLGPLIFARQAEIIAAHLADARAKGARVLSGGAIEQHGGGAWLRPTVLVDVDHGMRVMNEETFGPVIPVMPYDDVDEAVRLANDSEFGLSAAVLGAEPEALAVAARLQVGAVSINDGGLTTEAFDAEKSAFRYSGLGASRMGASGLTRFLRKRAVLIQRGSAKTLADYEESRAKR